MEKSSGLRREHVVVHTSGPGADPGQKNAVWGATERGDIIADPTGSGKNIHSRGLKGNSDLISEMKTQKVNSRKLVKLKPTLTYTGG